jgi:hypothetical protein
MMSPFPSAAGCTHVTTFPRAPDRTLIRRNVSPGILSAADNLRVSSSRSCASEPSPKVMLNVGCNVKPGARGGENGGEVGGAGSDGGGGATTTAATDGNVTPSTGICTAVERLAADIACRTVSPEFAAKALPKTISTSTATLAAAEDRIRTSVASGKLASRLARSNAKSKASISPARVSRIRTAKM